MKLYILLVLCSIGKLVVAQYYYDRPNVVFETGTNKDVKKDAGYIYTKPENPLEIPTPTVGAAHQGYVYPKPKKTFFISPKQPVPTPITHQKSESKGYNYPIPKIPFKIPEPGLTEKYKTPSNNIGYYSSTPKQQEPVKSVGNGYQYPKPQLKFDLPSAKPVVVMNDIPIIKQTNTNEKVGYQYPKPKNELALPTPKIIPKNASISPQKKIVSLGYKPTKPVAAFTNSPIKKDTKPSYQYPKPQQQLVLPTPKHILSNTYIPPQKETLKVFKTGYQYPKPKVPFELSLAKPVSPVKTSYGYQYPKPQTPFNLAPENSKIAIPLTKKSHGYDYPKPSILFEEPQTQSTTKEPSAGYNYPIPKIPLLLPPSPTNGYDYPKPSIHFTIPSNPPTTTSATVISVGYKYPKPLIPFEPERTKEIPQAQLSGYRYLKPSTPFES